jgi:hypothetical protein
VIKALKDNGIENTAIHNHMLDDEPRAFSIHFWANNAAVKLGLRPGWMLSASRRRADGRVRFRAPG